MTPPEVLLDDLIVAVGDQGNPGHGVIGRFSNAQTADIEISTAEQTGHPGQDSGFVFDKYGDGVAHTVFDVGKGVGESEGGPLPLPPHTDSHDGKNRDAFRLRSVVGDGPESA